MPDHVTPPDHEGRSPADRAGLSGAVEADDEAGITGAIARLRLLHAVLLGFGGMPLLHEGDERGLSAHHRAGLDAAPPDINTPAGRMFAWTQKLVAARRTLPHLHAGMESRAVPGPDPRVLLLRRDHPLGVMLAVSNFSAGDVAFPTAVLRDILGERAVDHLSGQQFTFSRPGLRLEGYRALWLTAP